MSKVLENIWLQEEKHEKNSEFWILRKIDVPHMWMQMHRMQFTQLCTQCTVVLRGILRIYSGLRWFLNKARYCTTHPIKIDLNKKLAPKQKTIQTFNIDAYRFRKTKNESSPTWEIGVAN